MKFIETRIKKEIGKRNQTYITVYFDEFVLEIFDVLPCFEEEFVFAVPDWVGVSSCSHLMSGIGLEKRK
jgi:hypothetical protein